jgi:thymidylate kinase
MKKNNRHMDATPFGKPMVGEIAGPSGAGKSTVSALLNQADQNVVAGLTVWKIPRLSLAASGVVSIPDITRLIMERRCVDEHEVKQVIRMHAFGRQLRPQARSGGHAAVFFDEGVVFALAKLRADVRVANMSKAMRRWEAQMIEEWGQILDIVIWIDAPNEILLDRIRSRAKEHRMKEKPADEVFKFLDNYRTAYESVLSQLQANGKTRVLRIDSSETKSEEIADSILDFRHSAFAARPTDVLIARSHAALAND